MNTAIPQHIAENARSLYRECMRRADYLGNKQGNRNQLLAMVRWQFKKNMYETDPQKIQEMKQAAVRGLFNYMMFEAHSMLSNKDDDD